MSQNFTTVKEVEAHAKDRMEKALADLQHEMATIRTGRASINILDAIRVDSYGVMSPLNHVGTLHVAEPQLLTISPFDPSHIAVIEKAIRTADLGLNPSNDGKLIRIPIPALNQERRKELAKKLHQVAEGHRVSTRNVRRDANESFKKLLKDKLISEDDDKRAHDDVQKMTDATMVKLEALVKAKEKEILELK